MEAKLLPVFLAGLVSFVTPCVRAARARLPLGRLRHAGRRGRAACRHGRAAVPRRVQPRLRRVRSGRGGLGGLGTQTGKQVAGIVLVVFGLAFLGLLRFLGSTGSQIRSSSRVRGGAARACSSAAPLPSAPRRAWARSSPPPRTRGRQYDGRPGILLLFVYSLGLALPFVAVGAGFSWATSASRWLRDRYRILQAVGGLSRLLRPPAL